MTPNPPVVKRAGSVAFPGVAVAALALAASVPLSLAAEGSTVRRIGYLTLDTPTVHKPYGAAFGKGLEESGYVEGKNLLGERRFAANDASAIQALLAELIGLKVEVLVTDSTTGGLAAQDATRTIPIVALSGDPVAAGLVASLGRPSRNVTSVTTLAPGLTGKRLALLKEIAPRTREVALVWNPDNLSSHFQVREARAVATDLGLRLTSGFGSESGRD